jgi:hypothetical protein
MLSGQRGGRNQKESTTMGNVYGSLADPPKVTAQILDENGWCEVVVEIRGGAFVFNLRSPEHGDRLAIAIADALTTARAEYRDAEQAHHAGPSVDDLDDAAFYAEMDAF